MLRKPRRHSLGSAIAVGTGLVLLTMIGGSWLLMERTRQTAIRAADATVQNAALIVESVVNRQLLQVDGALVSLPTLFSAAADRRDIDSVTAARLAR